MNPIVIKRTSELSREEIEQICTLFKKIFPNHSISPQSYVNHYSSTPLGYSIHALLKNEAGDIVGNHNLLPNFYLFDGKRVLFAYGAGTMILKEYRNFFNRCNVVVFQTEMARDVYHISRKSVIIPNPVISRCGQMAFKTYRSGKNIVSAGRLSKEKNFIGLIRAFAQNQERLGNSKLIIYGDGPEYYNLQTLVKQLKVQNRVLLPGNVKDFTKQEDDGGIFVLNSLNEGMPNALLEAMGAGYACIASDCPIGAPAWLSDNGRRVRLIPVADDKALGDAMVDIYNNDSIALELRINAREILDILDPERIKQLWLSLIESVIDDRKY